MDKREYHEINRYPDNLFPVEIYRVSESGIFPFGRGIQDFHWHDELQFALAIHGSLTLQADARQYTLNEGDAAFINSGIIHAVTRLSSGGQYTSLNFPYKMLSFFSGSRMEKEYVLPYVTGGHLPVVILRSEIASQNSVIEALYEINTLWDHHLSVQNKYLISIKIAALWHTFLANLPDENNSICSISLVHRQRLQLMLSFIYEHYSEEIGLADISGSANVSAGECCRIFREHLQTTPYQFLTEYRVRKSTELLSGPLAVSEIAGLCGYNQPSNYIAKFKSIMGCTPTQYRKHYNH
ncbi:MAG: AraC family transcriptional regulator [Clostridiales bacterium]|nr:AraC family transcriptional regulator [Clostridiales bacterium]